MNSPQSWPVWAVEPVEILDADPGRIISGERQLAFRDALRGDPALVEAYAALKRDLAGRYADDCEAYTAAKHGFIQHILDL